MKKIILLAFIFCLGFLQAQVKNNSNTTKKKIEKEWINPVKLTKEEKNRPYMDEVLKTRDSLTPKEAERRRKNIAIGNPFAKYGVYPKIATLSKGKYLEFHDKDSIVIIGSVKYNTKQKKIVELLEIDLSDPDAQPIGDTHGRWISPDPLSEEFPDWTPYRYGFNNPITFTDPTGMLEDIYEVDNQGNLTWKAESETDVIYASKNFDSKGNLNTENDGGVEVGEKGYIAKNLQEINLSSPIKSEGKEESSNKLSTLSFFNNESKALEVAEYMYKNTNVEFSNSSYNSEKGGVFSVLSTLHMNSSTLVDPKSFMKNFSFKGNYFMSSSLFANDHNHPMNTLPSGYMFKNGVFVPRPSDMKGSRMLDYHNTIDSDLLNVRFRVYTKGKYLNYNSNGAN